MAVCQLSVPGVQGGTKVCQNRGVCARLIIKRRAPLCWYGKVVTRCIQRCYTRRRMFEGVSPSPCRGISDGRSCFIRLSQVVSNLPDAYVSTSKERDSRSAISIQEWSNGGGIELSADVRTAPTPIQKWCFALHPLETANRPFVHG